MIDLLRADSCREHISTKVDGMKKWSCLFQIEWDVIILEELCITHFGEGVRETRYSTVYFLKKYIKVVEDHGESTQTSDSLSLVISIPYIRRSS